MASTSMIFLHHSVGANFIDRGDLRGLLRKKAPDLAFSDYGYNAGRKAQLLGRIPGYSVSSLHGLHDAAGRFQQVNYAVPADDTDPDGLATIFRQRAPSTPPNTLTYLLQYDVLAFKSCFTAATIPNDETLERFKQDYRAIRATMDQHPDKLFIALTPPPRRASETNPTEAARARAYARWIMSDEFHGRTANIATFDLFDPLASPEGQPDANTLRPEYSVADPNDSHPNTAADAVIAPVLADFIATTVAAWRSAVPA
jgi:hypothetical protein